MSPDQDGSNEGGSGHPLPDSVEAREGEIPEHLVREKGHGDDEHAPSRPSEERTSPDGERYKVGSER